jgi:2-keto-4-pentenoate hydratase
MPAPAASAISLIWQCLQGGGGGLSALPPPLRPRTRSEGYAIQACLPGIAGQAVVGWKIAATSRAGQEHIGVPGPLAGRILASFAHPDGAAISLAGNRMRVAEAEFGFLLDRDLPPRAATYGVDEVLAAVARLVPVIEVPDSRFEDFAHAGEAQLLADNACAGRFIVGADTGADWRGIDLCSHPVQGRVLRDGRTVLERTGSGAAVLGDPRVALAWLVNELSGLGLAAEAGQLVSTGTCFVPLPVQPGDLVSVEFGPLGQVAVRFEP